MVQDRRVRKSKQAIQSAFIQILKNQSFEKLTVQQLTETADINRSTFYGYYLDKYDFLEELENDIVQDIQAFIDKQHDKEDEDMVKNIVTYLVEYVHEQRPLFKTLFSIGKASMMQEKLYALIYHHLSAYKKDDNTIEGMPFSYYMSYVAGAGISLIKHWVEDTDPISKEDLIYHFNHIVNYGAASMIQHHE